MGLARCAAVAFSRLARRFQLGVPLRVDLLFTPFELRPRRPIGAYSAYTKTDGGKFHFRLRQNNSSLELAALPP